MLFARTALKTTRSAAPRVAQQARGIHVENTLHNNFPFKYEKKGSFLIKATAFMGAGFALPFAAVEFKKTKQ